MQTRLKLTWVALLVSVFFGGLHSAHAYYDPSSQRWLNRDPLGSGIVQPGATKMMDNELYPFEFFNAGNLYHYVYNNPINQIDPLGLDVWVIKDLCGIFGHVWVVGDNGDGTYWDSSKFPNKKAPFSPVLCGENVEFNPNSGFSPRDEWRFGDALCFKIIKHVKTSPAVDKKLRDEAERRSERNPGWYVFPCNTCRQYATQLTQ